MATAAGQQLTEAHRLAQARLGAGMVAQMHRLWSLLDPRRLDQTFDTWLLAALPFIQAQRSQSSKLAGSYLTTFKAVEVGLGTPITVVYAADAAEAAVATSLLVTGPVSIKAAMSAGQWLADAVDIAEASSSAAAMRIVLDGGRETITGTLAADKQATGWVRVASAKACDFCSMLEGNVYSADTADFPAHDGCSCSAEPQFA